MDHCIVVHLNQDVESCTVLAKAKDSRHQKLTLVTAPKQPWLWPLLYAATVQCTCAGARGGEGECRGGSGFARGPDYHRFITSCLPVLLPHNAPCSEWTEQWAQTTATAVYACALSKAQEWNKWPNSWIVKETRRAKGLILHQTTQRCIPEPPSEWAETTFPQGCVWT